MRDRFTRGIVAGLVASLPKDLIDLTARYVLHFSDATFLDYNGILLLGQVPRGFLALFMAQTGELTLSGSLGLLYVYLISRHWSSRRLLLKSTLYGIGSWYFLYVIPTLFQLPGIMEDTPQTALVHLISTAAFGFAMGATLRYLNRRDNR